MGAERFHISETNPNDGIGGGGCLCGERRPVDQHGPFAVFHAQEMADGRSPHAVLCVGCAWAVCRKSEGEWIYSGEPAGEVSGESQPDSELPYFRTGVESDAGDDVVL